MLAWLDGIPLIILVILAIALGGAPFQPEPHLVEKTRMLFDGTLSRWIDIFDLVLHSSPLLLLLLKGFREATKKKTPCE